MENSQIFISTKNNDIENTDNFYLSQRGCLGQTTGQEFRLFLKKFEIQLFIVTFRSSMKKINSNEYKR